MIEQFFFLIRSYVLCFWFFFIPFMGQRSVSGTCFPTYKIKKMIEFFIKMLKINNFYMNQRKFQKNSYTLKIMIVQVHCNYQTPPMFQNIFYDLLVNILCLLLVCILWLYNVSNQNQKIYLNLNPDNFASYIGH